MAFVKNSCFSQMQQIKCNEGELNKIVKIDKLPNASYRLPKGEA